MQNDGWMTDLTLLMKKMNNFSFSNQTRNSIGYKVMNINE